MTLASETSDAFLCPLTSRTTVSISTPIIHWTDGYLSIRSHNLQLLLEKTPFSALKLRSSNTLEFPLMCLLIAAIGFYREPTRLHVSRLNWGALREPHSHQDSGRGCGTEAPADPGTKATPLPAAGNDAEGWTRSSRPAPGQFCSVLPAVTRQQTEAISVQIILSLFLF